MNIVIEAHGSFPAIYQFDSTVPRIAFFNQNNPKAFLDTQIHHDNLLVIGANDMDEESLGCIEWFFLQLPSPVCSWAKRWSFNRSRKHDDSYAPMNLLDAIAILEFFWTKRIEGHSDIIVSCDYGKSRSATTALFLLAVLGGSLKEESVAPNKWVHRLLKRAESSLDLPPLS